MMQEKNQRSWNRELTPREARQGKVIIVWAVLSFGTMFFYPKVGIGLLMLGIVVSLISTLFWRRGLSSEQQDQIQQSMREIESKPLMRLLRYMTLAIVGYLVIKAIAAQIS